MCIRDRGEAVSVVVCKNEAEHVMPTLTGMNQEQALRTLSQMGLGTPMIVEEETAEEGLVVRQYPESGATVSTGDPVTITVGKRAGKLANGLTSFVGDAFEDVIEEAEELGFKRIILYFADEGKAVSYTHLASACTGRSAAYCGWVCASCCFLRASRRARQLTSASNWRLPLPNAS